MIPMKLEKHGLVSKVLVLDEARQQGDCLKDLCEECGLVGIRPPAGGKVLSLLRANVDLGGILLHEGYRSPEGDAMALARAIHTVRPELPIFLRRDTIASLAGLSERDAAVFRCAYTFADLEILRATLDASIFSRVYPNELVRGITEMTATSLATLFKDCDIDVETPYLVKDRIIYGEMFTMIAIESNWCRGYMMLQATEGELLALIDDGTAGFREINNVLGEATNLIWGSFKNRYAGHSDTLVSRTQVPIIINHQRRYISFGSDDPQLCLRYALRSRSQPALAPVTLLQRFVFNLSWSPEDFGAAPSVDALVAAGELELF
jgi:hypothetical protein